MALRKENPPPCSIRKLLTIVLEELLSKFWIPSRIPTKAEKDCLDQLQKLVKRFDSIRKYSQNRRQKQIEDFNTELTSLCDISHRCAEQLLRSSGSPSWKIDFEFLQGQREKPQRGIMQGHDNVLANKEKIKEKKRLQLEIRREKETRRKSQSVEVSCADEEPENNNDPDFDAPLFKKKKKDEVVNMNLSTKNLVHQTTAVADRLALLTLLLGDGVPESEKRIRICTIEVEVPNLIGTVELFRALRARYPQHSFQAIIGSDLVKDLPQWRHPAALQREVSFLVVPRGLKSENEIIEVRPEFQIEYLPSPFSFTVSSTTLRALLADKKSIIGLMPRSLIEYVERNNLYDGVR